MCLYHYITIITEIWSNQHVGLLTPPFQSPLGIQVVSLKVKSFVIGNDTITTSSAPGGDHSISETRGVWGHAPPPPPSPPGNFLKIDTKRLNLVAFQSTIFR